MRSLKHLMGGKKPLVNRNTGIINFGDNYIPNLGNITYLNTNTNNFDTNTNINSNVVFRNLPNSPIGLAEGSVWRDGEGILRIV
jgi:hypothetical protein